MKKINLSPYALVRSTTMKLNDTEQPVNYTQLGKTILDVAEKEGGVPVIADVTASDLVQTYYKEWLAMGISVCTANKGIFAGRFV